MDRLSNKDFGNLGNSEGRLGPIETRYKGYRMRSRLEARWATFFDTFMIRWEYEKEGYMLPSGPYLPDFWLARQSTWAEIKGAPFTPEERQKCEELVTLTEHECLLLDGLPEDRKYTSIFRFGGQTLSAEIPLYLLVNRAHSNEFYTRMIGGADWNPVYDAALLAAKSARFEFGEQGGL